jgi:hypothetical protein
MPKWNTCNLIALLFTSVLVGPCSANEPAAPGAPAAAHHASAKATKPPSSAGSADHSAADSSRIRARSATCSKRLCKLEDDLTVALELPPA